MFKSVFNGDNWLFRPFGWLVDVVVLSVMWVVCALLLVPFGGGTAAPDTDFIIYNIPQLAGWPSLCPCCGRCRKIPGSSG